MKRRTFVAGMAAGMAAPHVSGAQKVAKFVTVGVLAPAAGRNPIDGAFEQSLKALGWVTNENVKIETRYWAGRPDAVGPLVAELVGLGVDVLVAWGGAGAMAAKRAAKQVPVVFLAAGDPVKFGLVSSLVRPGGNATGVSFDASLEIEVKKLELLKEAVPGLAQVALLVPTESPRRTDIPTITATAKQSLNLIVREIETRAPAEIETAVRKAKEHGAQAMSVWTSSPVVWGRQLSELAIAHGLPSIHWFRENALAGGMLSYAPSLTDIAGRGAVYVDRILRGAKPADLPVEQPTKFELIINLKTARALGLTIPPSLLLRAGEVIE